MTSDADNALLIGRACELSLAQAAQARAEVRAILAHGAGGAGKTALMRQVLETARSQGALTGVGKYPEGRDGRDLDPVIAAVESAVAAGLDQLYDPEEGLADLARTLGENAHVLAGVGGGLLRSLAGEASGPPITAEEAQGKISQALLQVIRWLEGFGAPVLLLVDDWGRGGSQARRFFALVLSDTALVRTRLLLTERDEEAAPRGRGPDVARIAVGPLNAEARLQLAERALGERQAAAAEVLAFVGEAAARPFDLIESARVLTAADAIVRIGETWRLDGTRAVTALAGAAAVSAVRQALASDTEARILAQLLAIHGDGALPADLARAAALSETSARSALLRLTDHGLVRWSQPGVEFTHDRLRAEVLLELTPAIRRPMARALALALRDNGARADEGDRGMTMLWLKQEAGLHEDEPRWWRDAFIQGATTARETGDRVAADRFTDAALQLAAAGAGETYPLLAEAALAAIALGRDGEARRYADRLELFATTPVEKAVAEELRVFARRASGDLDAALEIAREVLARKGVKASRRVTPWSLARAVLRIMTLDPRKAVTPLPTDRLQVEAPMMRALNGVGSLLFERDPRLVVLLITHSLSTDLVYGTAAGAGTYSLMCCAFGNYWRAARWAEASDRLQRANQPLRAVAKQYSTSFGHVFSRPRPLTRSRGDEMEALAYVEGDLAVAAYGNRDKVLDALFCDDPLDKTAALADRAIEVAIQLGEPATLPHVQALAQFIAHLRTPGATPWRLDGVHYDATRQFAWLQGEGMANVARAIVALEALLGVLFGRYPEVATLADRPWPRFSASPFQGQSQIFGFATGLALYRSGRRPSAFVRWNLRRLSRLNPNDFRHRERMLAAEHARVSGRARAAMKAYGEAVTAAAASRCLLEHGLVAIAAAEGAEMLGESGAAVTWRAAAREAWTRLGAVALLAERCGEVARHDEAPFSALAAAERISQAKSRLLATVGHELRGPLQGALSLIDLAESQTCEADLPTLRHAIGRLAGLVDDLTHLGALDGGVLPLNQRPFDARVLASAVVALHQASASAAGRTLTLAVPETAFWVLGDEGRIGQVLGNLVVNALRHGQGPVDVTLSRPVNGRLRLSVADDGPDLDEAQLRRIFEPFDRGGRGGDETGLGVGLFLGRRLARAMGGDLRVRALSRGKAFDLEIDAPTATPPTDTAGPSLNGLRILLVEDAELARLALAALLRGEGGLVTEADGVEAARTCLTGQAFDLLLLDQRLGDGEGLDVAAEALALPAPPRIVLMSAETTPNLVERAAREGVNQVLAKPLSLAALRQALGEDGDGLNRVRRIELEAALGEAAQTILAALRPALEGEIERLERAIADDDAVSASAQRHRLQGIAAQFGLTPLAKELDLAPIDQALPQRLRMALTRIDWAAVSRAEA